MTNPLRTASKQQVAAARALLNILHTRALRPATAATDTDEIVRALMRLDTTTERLARETYQPHEETA